MQAYTEILPPTAVTHAVRLPFLHSKAHNLVVAKTSLLQIFETKFVQSDVHTNGTSSPVLAEESDSLAAKLVLIGEYPLAGTVTSLAAIKTLDTKSGGKSLLISFKDARVSLVEWDPETYGLSTISIHYYEGEDLQGSPWAPDIGKCSSFLTVDPSSRCAALKFGQRHVAILPFRQAGDDLTMGDYDADLDGATSKPAIQASTNGNTESKQTPYVSSFVLPLTALDPTLIHPVDLAFLHEYREPTLGVLSSSRVPSHFATPDRKDSLSYTVFTLDLEQRARTPLLSLTGLPCDLHKLVSLPLPIGGTLLLGGNEIVHVDQSGKTNAIAVNDFARQSSSFSMVDQSDLAMKLEGCGLEQLSRVSGDMLLVLKNGEFAILKFRIDGRSVSGLTLQRVSPDRGGNMLACGASCVVSVGHDTIFIGSEDADSVLIRCSQRRTGLARKRSHAEMLGIEEPISDDELIEDEDDLYGHDSAAIDRHTQSTMSAVSVEDVYFSLQDRLINLSPTGKSSFGLLPKSYLNKQLSTLDLIIPVGRGNAGGLAFLNRSIEPQVVKNFDLGKPRNAWHCKASKVEKEDGAIAKKLDFIITTSSNGQNGEISTIYSISEAGVKQCTGTNFESDTATIDAGVLFGGSRIVQVSPGQIQCYDADLGLAQIVPMIDDETDDELKIQHTSFSDLYLLVVRDNNSIAIFKTQKNGDLEEIDDCATLNETKWASGCVHNSSSTGSKDLAYLLAVDGSLHIYNLPNLEKPVYVANDLRNLPSILSSEYPHRRPATREALKELIVCDLGDATAKSAYMIVRTASEELIIYQPFHFPRSTEFFTENLRWQKVRNTRLVPHRANEMETSVPLRYVENLNGYSAVLSPGTSASLVMKEASSLPKVLSLSGSVSILGGIDSIFCENGLISIDGDDLDISFCQLQPETQYGQGWTINHLSLGQEVTGVCYHAESGLYVVGTNSEDAFTLPEDDWHQEWATENISLAPVFERGSVKLLNPTTKSIVHELSLEADETILCMSLLSLCTSEKLPNDRRSLIVVGTAQVQGEDLPCNGSIYIIDVISAVPHPSAVHPETTDKALKLIKREEVRGPVTAISEIGTEGFFMVAQGQKCMVRGLKEDGSVLPIAFLDVQCYVSSIKNVKGTGLAVVADAMMGVWLVGFSAEPYAIKLFGKSSGTLEIIAAEVLPNDKQLFILLADASCNLHVFEFNPEDPKSLSGQRLLHKSTFHTGHFPTSMTLLPTLTSSLPASTTHILLTTTSGALALLTPLTEPTYRRLSALQTHLTYTLSQACGLNPRAYRNVEAGGLGRGVLDGNTLVRWSELGVRARAEVGGRVEDEEGEVERDLEGLVGKGCGWLL